MKKVLTLLIASIVFLLSNAQSFAYDEQFFSYNSLDELVKSSDLIFVGKLHHVVSNKKFYGYQDNAEQLEILDKKTPINLGVYKTNFSMNVNQLLKDISSRNKEEIILGVFTPEIKQDLDELNSNMLKNKNEIKKQIFFLRRNSDETYSLNTMMGALHVEEDDDVMFLFNNKKHDFFGEQNIKLSDLIKKIKDISDQH